MYIDKKAGDLEYGSSYESWSRLDNIETKAVESEIRIKLRIHSIRTNRVDSTVLDVHDAPKSRKKPAVSPMSGSPTFDIDR